MIDKIKTLLKKYEELITYVIVGGLTTVINFAVYYPLNGDPFNLNYLLANCIAWFAAMVFSYAANKIFVFKDNVRGFRAVSVQFLKFALSRLATLGIEEIFMYVFVDYIGISENIVKFPVAIVVIIVNYIFGKMMVFRRKNGNEN